MSKPQERWSALDKKLAEIDRLLASNEPVFREAKRINPVGYVLKERPEKGAGS